MGKQLNTAKATVFNSKTRLLFIVNSICSVIDRV